MAVAVKNDDLIEKLGSLALATRLKRLSDQLMSDVAKLYREHHLNFEPRWFALLFLLHEQNKLSIVAASQLLGFTHPAIIQLAGQMEKKKLIKTSYSKTDGRRRIIILTEKGRKIFNAIQPLLNDIKKANDDLLNESGSGFLYQLSELENSYQQKNIYKRVKLLQSNSNDINILTYKKQYAGDFKRLNIEWIKKYFKVEAQDKLKLNNPEKEIIDNDGQIFFARFNNEIVGTVAMIKHDDTTYELAKMGVTEKYRGLKIGSKLLDAAINFAKEKNASAVILDTNSKLAAALALYKKKGFRSYAKKELEIYERADVNLKLNLKQKHSNSV